MLDLRYVQPWRDIRSANQKEYLGEVYISDSFDGFKNGAKNNLIILYNPVIS